MVPLVTNVPMVSVVFVAQPSRRVSGTVGQGLFKTPLETSDRWHLTPRHGVTVLLARALLSLVAGTVLQPTLRRLLPSRAHRAIVTPLGHSFGHVRVNPLAGAASVCGLPGTTRVIESLGAEVDPSSHLEAHTGAPVVAGLLGSVRVTGLFLGLF